MSLPPSIYPTPQILSPLLPVPKRKKTLTPRRQNIATQEGPHQETARDLYSRLRRNLVETVYQSWEETGFAWEQYNPETGKGQRTQHFTGWTSMIVKIMNFPDLSGKSSGHDEL